VSTRSGKNLTNSGGSVIASTSSATPFLLVPCNSDAPFLSQYNLPLGKCVSLMSVNQPGAFVRHNNLILYVQTGTGVPFIYDSSFILHENQFYPGYSTLQSTTSCCQNNYVQVQTSNSVRITTSQSDTDSAFVFRNPSGKFMCLWGTLCDKHDLLYRVKSKDDVANRCKSQNCQSYIGQSPYIGHVCVVLFAEKTTQKIGLCIVVDLCINKSDMRTIIMFRKYLNYYATAYTALLYLLY